ncbi:TonB-dependent receptor plug domain-containing protein [Flavobacterium sp. FlaQc-48]|uniref:TonB-dependent receptor plug domain-containing protein n=1 Tax=Flavobacterium sp. FlaQc-48 TaxID=3374181 RepID=UPI00375682C2
MKNILCLLFLMLFKTGIAQNTEADWNTVYQKSYTEKAYLQLNNVLYAPGETVYFKAFVTESDNSPTTLSDYLYVDLFQGAKKADTQSYLVQNGNAVGSYKIPENSVSGIYTIKAYTKIQSELSEHLFEKTFFVQKVVSPRILMTLDFRKKAYGKGETCEADFELKNLESQPIKNYAFKYDVFIAGKKIDSLQAKTDDLGKAVIQFKLPDDLSSKDGILNVMLDYDNFKESVTRPIPVNLNFADLQFLPESGNTVLNEASSLFFIAKNEFGLPMDIGGFIEDEKGNKISDFKSIHDGMGSVMLNTKENKSYFAVITSPFKSQEKIALPQALKNVFVINAKKIPEAVALNIYAPLAIEAKILVRNTVKIQKTVVLSLKQGWNLVDLNTKELPVGIMSFSLLVENRIVAERLIFLNYQDGLKVEIKTDKENYLPREKVKVSIVTKDKNNAPIASGLSVSVVDSKLLTYIDDKQDNILSWLLLGFELKGKIHEPGFYFDDDKKQEVREEAIDLLLNTQGWRKYDQKNLQKLIAETKGSKPERIPLIEGFVTDHKNKAVSKKVLLFTDNGKVYETKSNSSGYFKFNRAVFSDLACLVAEGQSKKTYRITNSFSNQAQFLRMKDTLSNTTTLEVNYKPVEKKETLTEGPSGERYIKGNLVLLNEDSASLQEVVVTAGYGIYNKKTLTGSVVNIASREITNSLSGRIAGIQILSSSGQSGAADKIKIRGMGSVFGSRSGGQPLILVDGIPCANNENASVFGNLSLNSIESIAFFKDPSVTALYGSSGAYGVIVVTTKNKKPQESNILGTRYNYAFEYIKKNEARLLNTADNFYAPQYQTTIVEEKTDFRTCIYWNSIVQTDNKGEANFEFYTSDDNTSFKILAEGTSYKGDLGKTETVFSVKELIQADVKIPLFASQEDVILIPLWLKNNTENSQKFECKVDFHNNQTHTIENSFIELQPNESRIITIKVIADKVGLKLPFEIKLQGENFKTVLKKTIDIYSKGFPANIDISGTSSQTKEFAIADVLPHSIDAGFQIYYNPFSSIFDGLESMMHQPNGCFEQVSSTNYPNIMAMQLLAYKKTTPEFKERALKYLEIGYQKLKNYESKGGGFEWYGGNPGNEALTAYGLLQFNEMKEFINIDQKLIQRTIAWINSRKDDKGGFMQNPAKYGFSGIKNVVNNAYIVYVLSEIGQNDLEKQYQTALQEALKSKDLYRMNLMALASFNLQKTDQYKNLLVLIKNEIKKQGSKDWSAEQSVINSSGKSLSAEIASLYALALLKEKQITVEVSNVMGYIQACKTSYGFGSTQATALALKAITEFSKIKVTPFVENAKMTLNNQPIDVTQKDKNGNIILNKLEVKAGNNNFAIQIPTENFIPYLFYVQYYTYVPNNSTECKLVLTTKSLTNKLKISETARVEVELQNTSEKEVSNPIARIGIPGGLTPEPWQLKELVEKNRVDYYEIFNNELVFYFRKLNGKESRKINIDFKAIVPGTYKGGASSAYLYYENEYKNWNKGLEIEVLP